MNMEVIGATEDGKLKGTPEALAAYLRYMIPTYDNHRLKEALKQLNKVMQDVNAEIRNQTRRAETLKNEGKKQKAEQDKQYLTASYLELQKVRKLIYKRIAETEKFNSTAPVPNNLIQNYITTMQLVETFGEIVDYTGGGDPAVISGVEVSKTFQNQLAKAETSHIIDAIGYYVNKYRKAGGDTTEIQYQESEEWDSYMITDTFDNICDNGRAYGVIRKKIKEVLFGKERPLQYVTLFLPIDKNKKAYKKVQFINAVIEEGTKSQPRGWYANENDAEEMTKIGKVTLQVSAKLYRFLDPQYKNKQNELLDLSGGYHMRPLAFSDMVKNMFEEMRRLSQTVYKDRMQIDMTGFDNEKGLTAVTYIQCTWNKGLQNRTQNMVITHNELESKGYLPKYAHKSFIEKRQKKRRDVDAIARVISTIIETGPFKDSFPKCKEAYSDPTTFSVVLVLEQEKSPPQIP
jgi:hypothetical protein